MKSRLRRLTTAPMLGLATAALLAALAWHTLIREESPVVPVGTATPNTGARTVALADSPNTRRDTSGNRVIADAILSLDRRPQVSALLRTRAYLNELAIIGQGVYRQHGRGDERKIKWELQTQVGEERASLVQIVDDRFLWIDQRMPTERTVQRVDLWRLRRLTSGADAEPAQVAPGQALAGSGWQSFGGLPMTLESLARNFDFAAPRQLQLSSEPVYALRGVWKPHRLRELLGLTDETSSAELPARVPRDVLVLLGSRDYFPYLIEYRNIEDAVTQGDASRGPYELSGQPLMRVELYQVSLSSPIDPSEFVFVLPAGVDWIDTTQRYIDRVQRYHKEKLAATGQREKR